MPDRMGERGAVSDIAQQGNGTALLEQGRLSVTEVAMAVGYDSGQALARAFRQETGVAPRDWRRARMA